jgi:hypothetical protein
MTGRAGHYDIGPGLGLRWVRPTFATKAMVGRLAEC